MIPNHTLGGRGGVLCAGFLRGNSSRRASPNNVVLYVVLYVVHPRASLASG